MGLSGCSKKDNSNQNLSWQEQISAKALTEYQFTKLCQQAYKEKIPEANIEIVNTLELKVHYKGKEFTSYLGNIWFQCKDYPKDRVDVCNQTINTYLNILDDSTVEPNIDKNLIIPIIKDKIYLDSIKTELSSDLPIYAEFLAGDLYIIYGIYHGDRIQYLPNDDIETLDVPKENLRELAVSNLKKLATAVQRHDPEDFFVISSQGVPASSVILIEYIWSQQESSVSGDIIASIPCADLIFFTGSNNAEGIRKVKKEVQEVFSTEPKAISETLLIRKDGQWQVFTD